MGVALFALIGGTAFILLGRWFYRNPQVLYESSLYSRGSHPIMRLWTRLFAMLLIFVGTFALVAGPSSVVTRHDTVGLAVALGAAVLGAVFLRPSVGAAPRSPTGIAGGPAARHNPFLTRKGKVFLATMAAGVLLSTAEALSLPALGRGALWPDVATVTILVTAVAMLCEMLLLR